MISPQGYQITQDPENVNPFWDEEHPEGQVLVKRVSVEKTSSDNYDTYVWSYTDNNDVIHPLTTQVVSNKAGVDGATFTPHVSEAGIISWTNDAGLPNPDPINIKGPKGDTGAAGAPGPIGQTGPQGPRGLTGETGPQGEAGPTGEQGPAGMDGFSPMVNVTEISGGHRIEIITHDETVYVDVMDGESGSQGPAGYSPSVRVDTIENGAAIHVTDHTGESIAYIYNGSNGAPGERGRDGFSPIVDIIPIAGGNTIKIQDETQTHSFNVMNGEQGVQGPMGPTGPTGPAGPSNVVQTLTEGTEIATINGTPIYAPAGGGGGGAHWVNISAAVSQNGGARSSTLSELGVDFNKILMIGMYATFRDSSYDIYGQAQMSCPMFGNGSESFKSDMYGGTQLDFGYVNVILHMEGQYYYSDVMNMTCNGRTATGTTQLIVEGPVYALVSD